MGIAINFATRNAVARSTGRGAFGASRARSNEQKRRQQRTAEFEDSIQNPKSKKYQMKSNTETRQSNSALGSQTLANRKAHPGAWTSDVAVDSADSAVAFIMSS
jgi:hypothetical protein